MATNQLLNPGFEFHTGDDFDDWDENNAGTLLFVEHTEVHTGDHSVKYVGNGGAGAIYQYFTSVIGVTYTFKVWVKGEYEVWLMFDSNTDTESGFKANWEQITVSAVADGTPGFPGVIANFTGTGYADDAEVTHDMAVIEGTLSETLDAFTLVATGTVEEADIEGTLDETIDAFTLVGTGTSLSSVGALDETIDAFTLVATGAAMLSEGALDITIGAFTLAGAGEVTHEEGWYSPGHANAMPGFEEGMPVKVEVNGTVKFIGTIAAIRPTSGQFDEPTVEVEVHDWMGLLSPQEAGLLDIALNKRSEEALTLAMANIPVAPEATDFDVGVETFPVIFHKESPYISMASLFQRIARNEQGRIYMEGDGTLVFENRDARPMVTASSFTLDGLMTEFDISYERRDIFNVIRATVILHEVDDAATTILWELQDWPIIKAGQTLTFECLFRDPDTGRFASGLEIVDPLVSATHIKFGSVADGNTNDWIAHLDWSQDIGSNISEVTVTNNHDLDGYLNKLHIVGKGLYIHDPMVIESKDDDSIEIRGERVLDLRLEYIAEIDTGRSYATYLRGQLADSYIRARRITFLANQSAALAAGAIGAEVSTRFTAIEAITGISQDFFVNRLKYKQVGPNLWLQILAVPYAYPGTFIWDTSHWDNEEDARWAL